MSDGRVNIDTRLQTGNVRNDVQRVNQELGQIGSNMGRVSRDMRNTFGGGFAEMNRDIARGYTQVSAAHMGMMNEMKAAYYQQKAGMQGVREKQIEAQYGYFQLAQASGTYTGSMGDLLSRINEIGKAEKKAKDEAMNRNKLQMMSIYQTIGMMNAMSSTASRFQNNLTQMNNPLYNTSRLALTAVDSLDRLARSGSPQQLALEFLGANASVKQYNDFIRDLGTQMMALPIIFGLATVAAVKFYGALHGKVMQENTQYASAFNNMIEKLTKAFEPMRQAFAAVMIPVYNFVAAIAELIIKFNEAHPTMAKFIQGLMMLVPALMVILTPLALGIGYFKGLRAILFALRPVIMPVITGFAMMSPVAWVLAAAITGVVMVFNHFWKTSETFRNAINGMLEAIKNFTKGVTEGIGNAIKSAIPHIKAFGENISSLGKYLFWTMVDGDNFNDWVTHLPDSWQGAAMAVGSAISTMRGHIVSMFGVTLQFGKDLLQLGSYLTNVALTGNIFSDALNALPPSVQGLANSIAPALLAVNSFGQAILASGKYFFWAAADGDYYNDWLSHLPASWQNVALAVGTFIASMTTSFTSLFGPLNQIGFAFLNFGRYILSVVSTGDLMNGWLNLMPVGFQTAGVLIGNAILTIKTAISSLVEAIRLAMGGDTSQLGQIFMTILPTLISLLLGGLPALLITAARFLPTIVEGMNTMLPMLTAAITNIITSITTMITTYLPEFLNKGIEILTKVIEGIVQVLPTVVTTIVTVVTQMINTWVNTVGVLLPLVLDAGIKILMAVIDGIVKSLPKIIEACITVINKLVESLVSLLPKVIEAGIKILMALIDGIIKILPNLIQTAVKLITELCNMLIKLLPQLLDAGMKILLELIKGIIKILPDLIQAGIKIIVELVNILMQNMPKIWQMGMKILGELIKGIIQILPQLASTALKLIVEIVRVIASNLPQIWQAGMRILGELIKGILSLVGNLLSTITSNVIGGIKNCFSNAGSMLYDIGKNIIQGLVNGISGMVGKAVSTVKSVASDIKSGIADFFDIHSPSRVTYALGEFVTEGLANGIVGMSKYAVKKARTLAESVMDGFSQLKDDIVMGDFIEGNIVSDTLQNQFSNSKKLVNGLIDASPRIPTYQQTSAQKQEKQQNNNNPSESQGSAPTYLVMDKQIVGEILAQPVEQTNDRRKQRLAQFTPTTTPSF